MISSTFIPTGVFATIMTHETGEQLCTFELKTPVIFDQVQAGGRVPLSIGRALTRRARESLGLEASAAFHLPEATSSAARPG